MGEQKNKTIGFSVSSCPLWLFKELSAEANEYYNGSYWVVLVDWFRKAKQLEMMMNGGVEPEQRVEEVKIEEKDDKSIKLFGRNMGGKK